MALDIYWWFQFFSRLGVVPEPAAIFFVKNLFNGNGPLLQ